MLVRIYLSLSVLLTGSDWPSNGEDFAQVDLFFFAEQPGVLGVTISKIYKLLPRPGGPSLAGLS